MPPYLKIIFFLALAGMIFSGYLSAIKLFTGSCAFNESCPYFLGYPACWYGFAMYFSMFSAAGLALLGKISAGGAFKIAAAISFLGIIFAGNFAVREFLESRATGVLGFSTCVYGLIFYVLIFIFSAAAGRGGAKKPASG